MKNHSERSTLLYQDYPVTLGSESRTFRSGPASNLILFVIAIERNLARALLRLDVLGE